MYHPQFITVMALCNVSSTVGDASHKSITVIIVMILYDVSPTVRHSDGIVWCAPTAPHSDGFVWCAPTAPHSNGFVWCVAHSPSQWWFCVMCVATVTHSVMSVMCVPTVTHSVMSVMCVTHSYSQCDVCNVCHPPNERMLHTLQYHHGFLMRARSTRENWCWPRTRYLRHRVHIAYLC